MKRKTQAAQPPPEPNIEAENARRVRDGAVNEGWSESSWQRRLRDLADICEPINPQSAAEYRAWADSIERNRGGRTDAAAQVREET